MKERRTFFFLARQREKNRVNKWLFQYAFIQLRNICFLHANWYHCTFQKWQRKFSSRESSWSHHCRSSPRHQSRIHSSCIHTDLPLRSSPEVDRMFDSLSVVHAFLAVGYPSTSLTVGAREILFKIIRLKVKLLKHQDMLLKTLH